MCEATGSTISELKDAPDEEFWLLYQMVNERNRRRNRSAQRTNSRGP